MGVRCYIEAGIEGLSEIVIGEISRPGTADWIRGHQGCSGGECESFEMNGKVRYTNDSCDNP
jgi:hypothetical protein